MAMAGTPAPNTVPAGEAEAAQVAVPALVVAAVADAAAVADVVHGSAGEMYVSASSPC